jgi:hypothetical protein
MKFISDSAVPLVIAGPDVDVQDWSNRISGRQGSIPDSPGRRQGEAAASHQEAEGERGHADGQHSRGVEEQGAAIKGGPGTIGSLVTVHRSRPNS